MKKIQYILSVTAIAAITLTQSCQQPKPDQVAIDAKVTEAYNAAKTQAMNDAATACEANITAQVKVIQDSMAEMSSAQQTALLAKTQKDLKVAQAKVATEAAKAKAKAVAATKAKAAADAKAKATASKPTGPAKPVLDEKGNQQGTSTTRGSDVKADPNIKVDDKGTQQGTSTTR